MDTYLFLCFPLLSHKRKYYLTSEKKKLIILLIYDSVHFYFWFLFPGLPSQQ